MIFHPKNQGKGAVLIDGIKIASGKAIIIQDADLEYSPSDWQRMLNELETNKWTAVYGSRELNAKRRGYPLFVFGTRLLSFVINLIFKTNLTDSYTCYKLFKAGFLKSLNLKSKGFEIEAEITVKTLKAGGKITEVPISYNPRTFKQGKHIRVKDGIKGLMAIIRYAIEE